MSLHDDPRDRAAVPSPEDGRSQQRINAGHGRACAKRALVGLVTVSMAASTMNLPAIAAAAGIQDADAPATVEADPQTAVQEAAAADEQNVAGGGSSNSVSAQADEQDASAAVAVEVSHASVGYADADGKQQTVAQNEDAVSFPTKTDIVFSASADEGFEVSRVAYAANGIETDISPDETGNYTVPADAVVDGLTIKVETVEQNANTGDGGTSASAATDARQQQTITMSAGETRGLSGSWGAWKSGDLDVVGFKDENPVFENTVWGDKATIEARGSGTATITHSYGFGKSESWKITVSNDAVYLYTLIPGQETAEDEGNWDAVWNGMGVGHVTDMGNPADRDKGRVTDWEGKITFPNTTPKFPNIMVGSKTYTYDAAGTKAGTYSIRWNNMVVADDANAGGNGYNPTVEGRQTYHLNGNVILLDNDRVTVSFNVQQPEENDFEFLPGYFKLYNKDSSTSSVKQPTPQDVPSEKKVGDKTYKFDGWYTDEACTQKANFESGTLTANTDYYGRYVLDEDTLSYNANGGTGTVTPTKGKLGGKVAVASGDELSRAGYTFDGWNTKEDGTGDPYAAGSTYTLTSGVDVLYAQWKENTVTYEYAAQTGGSVSVRSQVLGAVNGSIEGSAAVASEGYRFMGWYTSKDGKPDEKITEDNAGNLHVQLNEDGTKLTPQKGDNGLHVDRAFIAVFAQEHSVSYEWKDAPATGTKLYNEKGESVTLSLPEDKTGLIEDEQYAVDSTYAKDFAVYTQDAYGNKTASYTFSGWKKDGEGTVVTGQQTMVNEDVTLKGTWTKEDIELKRYSVSYTWSNAPEDLICPVDAISYVNGQRYWLETQYSEGYIVNDYDEHGNVIGAYTFSGWMLDGKPAPRYADIEDKNVALTGTWSYESVNVERHNVVYSWTGLPTDGTQLYTEDGELIEPPLPQSITSLVPGAEYGSVLDTQYTKGYTVYTHSKWGNVNGKYVFSGWNDPNNGKIGKQDVQVTGMWTHETVPVEKHTVNYQFEGYGSEGYVPAGVTLPEQTKHELNEVVNPASVKNVDGWEFTGWTPTETSNVTMENGTFAMPGNDVVLTGSWKPAGVDSIEAKGYLGTYDAKSYGITVTGAREGDEISYTVDGKESENSFKDATKGAVTVTATVKRDGVVIKEVSAEVNITPAPLTVTTEGAEKVYDGTPLTREGEAKGTVGGETVDVVTYGTITNVGSVLNNCGLVYRDGAKPDNYSVTKQLGTLRVTPAILDPSDPDSWPVRVGELNDATYDGKQHQLKPSVKLAKNGEALAEGKDYTLSWDGEAVHVGSVTATVTFVGENIEGSVDVAYYIDPAVVTVTTPSKSKPYDGTPLTTGTEGIDVDGIADGETYGVTATGTVTNVGTVKNDYKLTLGGEYTAQPGDYTVRDVLGTLEITPAAVDPDDPDASAATVLAPANTVYNGSEQRFEPTVTDKQGNALARGTDYDLAWSDNATDAGTVQVTVTFKGNYAGEATVSYLINPATITVTVDQNQGKVQGQADPALTSTYDGIVDGEVAGWTGAITREPGEAPGTYAITQGTLALADNEDGNFKAANYTLGFTGAMFTITPSGTTGGGDGQNPGTNPGGNPGGGANPGTNPGANPGGGPGGNPGAGANSGGGAAAGGATGGAAAGAAGGAVAQPVPVLAAGGAAAAGVATAAAAPDDDAEAIADDANPLASGESIKDDANPLAGLAHTCWTHWLMLVGAVASAACFAASVLRRRKHVDELADIEDDILNCGSKNA